MGSVSSANVDISKFLPPDKSRVIKSLFRLKYPGFVLQMLEEGVHADITLTAIGGSVKAHRSVLSCVSPVFCAMFLHDMKEQVTSCVDISDMTIDALQLFLLLLYTVNEGDKYTSANGMHRHFSAAIDRHFVEFHDAVCKYQVGRNLKNVLKYAMVRNLSPENCWYYYERAQIPGTSFSESHENLCFCYIMCNYQDVIRCTETQEAMKRDTDLVHDIMVQAEIPAERRVAVKWFRAKKRCCEEWEAKQK